MEKLRKCVRVSHYQPNVIITSENQTYELANKISHKLTGGMILALSGELGTGKTTFTKGLATAFGITKNVTSPTFAIMNVYELPEEKNTIKTLVHIDVYRLESPDEILTIGVEDYLGEPNTLVVIEWPKKIQPVLDNYEYSELKFTLTEGGRDISGAIL